MADHGDTKKRKGSPFDDADADRGFTVLAMLAGSLVLIIIGTVIVTTLA